MILSRLASVVSHEEGAVLGLFAIAIGAFIMFIAFVVDAANWYEHKRHLQLQADAAALAGAQSFTLSSCSNSDIATSARRYGGSDSPDGTTVRTQPYNDQVGGTAATSVHILVNSSGYYGDTGAGDNTDPNGAPCAAGYVDIKATETHLPWFFGGAFVPKINAHARVSLVQETSANGTLPIAVPNPLPSSAAAIFIDETNGSVVATAPLSEVGVSGSLDMWQSSTTTPVGVTIPSRATGVVIALSGKSSMSLTGDLTAICDQALTDCYDANTDPPTNGVSFIRGYPTGGNGQQTSPPVLHSAELFPINCPNSAYFSNNTSTCNYELAARIDAQMADGSNMPNANQIYTANGIQLDSAADTNCGSVAGPGKCWHTPATSPLTLPANSGPNAVTMTWEETIGQVQIGGRVETCRTNGGNKCNGSFEGGAVIQRAFSAVSADTGHSSGPLAIVKLCNTDTDPGCATEDSHSYTTGSTPHFVVIVGIAGTLQNATSVSSPLVKLRIRSNTGQSLDCDPGYTNLRQELANGCRPSYATNTGSPDCSTIGTSALWSSTQPWPCIAVNTGRQPNDVAAGLNQRIFGTDRPATLDAQCALGVGHSHYNNWPNFVDNGGDDGFPPGDPRILNAYITTYGAFSHVNGTSGSVPIIGFGHFYVTGYIGQGGSFTPPSNCGSDPIPGGDTGLIVGHFIRYIDKLGGTGTARCDPNSINACVIVMTK